MTWLQLVWMYLPDGQSTVRHGHDAAGRERLARCGALLRGGDAREGRLLAAVEDRVHRKMSVKRHGNLDTDTSSRTTTYNVVTTSKQSAF